MVEDLLGSGAMGEVHRAMDTRSGRRVALKCLPARLAHDPRFRARFRTEANAVAALRHPHVVPIHEVGMIDDRPFIAMQLIDGVDLRAELRRRGPLDAEHAVAIVAEVAWALGPTAPPCLRQFQPSSTRRSRAGPPGRAPANSST